MSHASYNNNNRNTWNMPAGMYIGRSTADLLNASRQKENEQESEMILG